MTLSLFPSLSTRTRVRSQAWAASGLQCRVFFEQLIPFVARCTLNGEISRSEEIIVDAPELKFYVLNDLGTFTAVLKDFNSDRAEFFFGVWFFCK
jgi:hypothetical protein